METDTAPCSSFPLQSVEGRPVFEEALQFLSAQIPVHPLKLSPAMCNAAHDHCHDLGFVRTVSVQHQPTNCS